MPRIICTAPSRKASISPEGMGTNRKLTAATMAVMGRIESMDSCSFSIKSVLCPMKNSQSVYTVIRLYQTELWR